MENTAQKVYSCVNPNCMSGVDYSRNPLGVVCPDCEPHKARKASLGYLPFDVLHAKHDARHANAVLGKLQGRLAYLMCSSCDLLGLVRCAAIMHIMSGPGDLVVVSDGEVCDLKFRKDDDGDCPFDVAIEHAKFMVVRLEKRGSHKSAADSLLQLIRVRARMGLITWLATDSADPWGEGFASYSPTVEQAICESFDQVQVAPLLVRQETNLVAKPTPPVSPKPASATARPAVKLVVAQYPFTCGCGVRVPKGGMFRWTDTNGSRECAKCAGGRP